MVDHIHQNLAAGRWFGLTLAEQLGNVGSEVGRAAKWQQKQNLVNRDNSLDRALDLIDLTIADIRWQVRRRELCRVREILVDTFWGKREYNDTPEGLEKYFYQFALLARNKI